MDRPRIVLFLCAALTGGVVAAPSPPPPPPSFEDAESVYPLVWDSLKKTYDAKPGDSSTTFVFAVTNTGTAEVEIHRIQPSCSCTVASLPRRPWVLAPGASSSFAATVDFAGKHEHLSKTLLVESSHGNVQLTVVVNIPEPVTPPARTAAKVKNPL